ncbi:MAG: hypothetical protein K9N09_10400 [Candidatus Cloacimonetes bacterium]|nr:hypothetical protein [Candidatus Cloacimonadota bacterium]MCF7814589.1 hypothetical protein [Candidatus Cloacimonadota bacterium]MCF7869102.1 hypothetical protein [Candidatus Cloacimonadota bacterium]MCF7884519.1 hypothetical protein [Candidatus Cloacimonadota bacterium]
MKKTLFIVVILLVVSFNVFADYWGGTNSTSSDIFRSGNVGIGAFSAFSLPQTPLHIASSNGILFRLQQTSSSDDLFISSYDNSGNRKWNINMLKQSYNEFNISYNTSDPAFKITSSGNVGIGFSNYTSPTYLLHVNGSGSFNDDLFVDGDVGIGSIVPEHSLDVFGGIGLSSYLQATTSNGLSFKTDEGTTRMIVDDNGNVGIGTTTIPTGYKLAVDGKIIAEELKVEMSGNWSDFVFEEDYRLKTLTEVEDFISKNGHLPEIPSAEEVEQEGVNIGDMQAKLLQKVEELTLYLIEMQKQNKELKTRISSLETTNK